jgi:hypothetical protein
MNRKFSLLVIAVFMHLFASSGSAAESDSGPPVYEPEAPSQTSSPRISERLHAGSFQTTETPGKFEGEGGGVTGGIELGFVPKQTISYRLEIMYTTRRFDTPATVTPPAVGSVSGRMTLDTMAVLLGVRASYPPDRSYRVHATGGIGYFNSWLSASLSRFPLAINDRDASFGFHAGVGLEADLGKGVVGVDFRHWFVDGSFHNFGISNTDIGGNYLGISFGWYF